MYITTVVIGLIILIVFGIICILFLFKHKQEQSGWNEDWEESDGIIVRDIAYGPEPMNRLDLYLPAEIEKQDTANLILFIHGGSWISGEKKR